jgi:hypothetical protein
MRTNNAGVMMAPFWRTVGGFELRLGVNYRGHLALIGPAAGENAWPARLTGVSYRSC